MVSLTKAISAVVRRNEFRNGPAAHHILTVINSSLNQVALVPCATLGTNFVDIVDGTLVIGREVGRESAELWFRDLNDEVPLAEDTYIRMRNILTDPVRAAGAVVNGYRSH